MTLLDPPSDPDPPSILRRSEADRAADPVGFRALRALGIAQAQAASSDRWTDYNLHDPGVTILEALAYALTDLAYRADLPVADRFAGPDGTIDLADQALFEPQEIFPCRATTANDYRRLLLERVEGLADVRFVPGAGPDNRACLPGLHRLGLRAAETGDDVAPMARAARRAYRAHRTVGEDLDEVLDEIHPRDCQLVLSAAITGPREAAEIVAEIYRRCAWRIAGLPPSRSLAEAALEARTLEDLLTGPEGLTVQIDEAALAESARRRLGVNELRSEILLVEGVAEVTRLELKFGPTPPDPWAPCLATPGHGKPDEDALLVDMIQLHRRGVRVLVDARAVAAHRRARRLDPGSLATGRTFKDVFPLPKGSRRRRGDFRSVQEEFPVIYGLGRRAAPADGAMSEPRVEQLKAYLTLFDQLLANAGEQLVHIRDLLSKTSPGEGHDWRTYWRRILTDHDVPGVRALQDAEPEVIAEAVYRRFDDAIDRKSRVFDYLLALHGETFSQTPLRPFFDHLDSRELAATLLENKAEFVRQTVRLGRDRAAGFDTSIDLLANPEATTGLHRRIALLLGFRDWRARRLTAGVEAWPEPAEPPQTGRLSPVAWLTAGDDADEPELDALKAVGASQTALFAHGLSRERYRWEASARRLVLVDEYETPQCVVGEAASRQAAQRKALGLRRRLLELNDGCEGLHIVEHILLRPRDQQRHHLDEAFLALRVSVVFPNWTARTSRAAFQALARETVEINFPAHVAPTCMWLGLADMAAFEEHYEAWAQALLAYETADQGDGAGRRDTETLDKAAWDLAAFLRAHAPDTYATDAGA